jgi:BNR repeat-containing family member
VHWSEWKRLAAIEQGHYQIGAAGHGKIATMLNMHPRGKGLNWRTNLYYMESVDNGKNWRTAAGQPLEVPLQTVDNPALVRDYQSEGLLVYIKDLQFDPDGRPVLVYSTSRGFEPGPVNGERPLHIARWIGDDWNFHTVTTTDHNYDSASLSFDDDGKWRIIGPTVPGPQPFGTGGEMIVWISSDQGATWRIDKQLTAGSQLNHSYARRPADAHPGFFALWADGNARKPSESHLYYCDKKGHVFQLPTKMDGDTARPKLVVPRSAAAGSN